MKTCAFCGSENKEDTVYCSECGCDLATAASEANQQPAEIEDWVTVASFPNLAEAELAASQLRAHGIEVFVPDLAGLQSSNLTIRFAQIQVHPDDLETARKMLEIPEGTHV